MIRRFWMGILMLAVLPGCHLLYRDTSEAETEELKSESALFQRPGGMGKSYSLNPRMRAVEENLGYRR